MENAFMDIGVITIYFNCISLFWYVQDEQKTTKYDWCRTNEHEINNKQNTYNNLIQYCLNYFIFTYLLYI